MKNKVLPFSLLVLFAASLLISFTFIDEKNTKSGGNDGIRKDATSYLAKIRNNQNTGLLNPKDVLLARAEVEQGIMAERGINQMNWKSMGPDNFSGRTRAIIWDNQDPNANTIYAGGVSGGLWKSETTGLTWKKVNGISENLFVSSILQDQNGTIYVGTGEGFEAQKFSVFGDYGYTGGLIGSGIYKSTDGETFTQIPSTVPNPANSDTTDWIFINEIAVDDNTGRLWVSTNQSLKYSDDEGNSWQTPMFDIDSTAYIINQTYDITCDSFEVDGDEVVLYNPDTTSAVIDTISSEEITNIFELKGNSPDVKIASDGKVITMVDGKVFLSKDGNQAEFKCISNSPSNPYFITAENINRSTSISSVHGNDTSYSMTIENPFEPHEGTKKDLPSYAGRIEFAFHPNNPDHVYASAAHASTGYLLNIYHSTNKGKDWYVILPGSDNPSTPPSIDIFSNEGLYSNTIICLPDSTDKILVGGLNMWEGKKINEDGFFNWLPKSQGNFSFSNNYCHDGHHEYVMRPGHNNEVLIGTNGGIFIGLLSNTDYVYEQLVKGYMTTQFYAVDPTGDKEKVIAGAQEIGTITISGSANTELGGEMKLVGSGGYCEWSLINHDVMIMNDISVETPAFYRSEDAGETVSATSFLGDVPVGANDYLLPTAFWECFNNENSRDSVYFFARKAYDQGDVVQVRSKTWEYPFDYTLPYAMSDGDSILVKDLVTSKFFIGANNSVWMTLGMHDFTSGPTWFCLANTTESGFTGKPSCMGYSKDANHLYVGTLEGKLYRISNIALAYNAETADCNEPTCVVATSEIPLINPSTGEPNTQAVTSVCVDPQDDNRVLITMGNYGNDHYVFYTDNALDEIPDFSSIQGNLPKMPVYSSLIEMSNSNIAILGTEFGVYTTSNLTSGSPDWSFDSEGLTKVPVMMLRQQLVEQDPQSVMLINGIDTIYLSYPGTNNYGVIYGATFGRGIYQSDTYEIVGIDEINNPDHITYNLNVYPNPVKNSANLSFISSGNSSADLNVYDVNGKLMINRKIKLTEGNNKINLQLSDFPEGTFIIQIISGKNINTGKFIVIK